MFRRIVAARRRFGEFLSHYDWAAIIGSGLVLAFALLVLIPATRLSFGSSERPQYEKPDTKADGTDNQFYPWWEYSGAWVALFTIALTVSTVGLWWVTRRTLRHAETDSERQASDMKESLSIAKQAADAATAGNRAWIKIAAELKGPLTFGSEKVSLETIVTVENVGKSPATRVRVSGGIGFFNAGNKFNGLKFAVNKAQVSFSERVAYDTGRSAEDIARQQTIGDVVFPEENRPIGVNNWVASTAELRFVISGGDGTKLVAVYYAVSAEYRTNGNWADTTVVYVVEKTKPISPEENVNLFDSAQSEFPLESIRLRKLNLHTSAT